MVTFGQRLRELRKAKGMTQRELADRAGINFTYLSKLENDVMSSPRGKTIAALANVLGADEDELFGLAGKIPSHLMEGVTPEIIRTLRSLREGGRPRTDEQAAFRQRGIGLGGSEPKCTEEAREEREDCFRALAENSVDGILVMNGELDIVYESPAAALILGYNPGELAGKDALAMVHADDVSTIARELTELAANPGETGLAEARVRHKDGTWRIVEAVGKNLLHDPDVNGILIDYRDITERRQEEEGRAQSAAASTTAQKYDLTDSEKQVLALILEGKSNPQIAERLVTGPSTVKFHVGNILRKLGVTNRTEAAVLALRHHLGT